MDVLTDALPNVSIPESKVERKRLLTAYPGLLNRTARRHKIDSSLISRVFNGYTKSARIKALIEKELGRRIAEAQQQERSAA